MLNTVISLLVQGKEFEVCGYEKLTSANKFSFYFISESHPENEDDESENNESSSLTGNCPQISHHSQKLLDF